MSNQSEPEPLLEARLTISEDLLFQTYHEETRLSDKRELCWERWKARGRYIDLIKGAIALSFQDLTLIIGSFRSHSFINQKGPAANNTTTNLPDC